MSLATVPKALLRTSINLLGERTPTAAARLVVAAPAVVQWARWELNRHGNDQSLSAVPDWDADAVIPRAHRRPIIIYVHRDGVKLTTFRRCVFESVSVCVFESVSVCVVREMMECE